MNTETILVVDDDVEIAKSIQLYLNSQNYKVLIAHDGQEALDLFHNQTIDLTRECHTDYYVVCEVRRYRQNYGVKHRCGRLYHETVQSDGVDCKSQFCT